LASRAATADLRSPVNNALRSLQFLKCRASQTLSEEDLSILAESIKSIERLSDLMHDLLTFTMAANAPQQQKLIPVKQSLDVAVENLQHHIAASGATVTACELPTISANHTQLAMVFQNLISNALKYGREEGTIAGVSKKLKVHRRMVREAIESAMPKPRKKTERPRWKLANATAFVDGILEADRKAPRKQRHAAQRIWQRMRVEFPDCGSASGLFGFMCMSGRWHSA